MTKKEISHSFLNLHKAKEPFAFILKRKAKNAQFRRENMSFLIQLTENGPSKAKSIKIEAFFLSHQPKLRFFFNIYFKMT